MAQIRVLDSETIDKIAAGEVVERPASVVKELVENAIDAGATAITVEAKEGGIAMVRVTDNGIGMEKNQVQIAFMRHATSKIEKAEDLDHILSLGFRGEALSSIAAVSQVELITKTKDNLTGIRYLMSGAVEGEMQEVGAPDGTTFIMRNLFYNTPVRKKFLKQPSTEASYIVDLMEHLALSRPDISFKLVVGSQTRFHTSGNGDLKEVIYRIYGREISNAVIPIQKQIDGITIEGYLGKPILVRSNRNFEIYYINGRFVKSSVVSKAIEEGYKEYLMQHKFPFCVLHISIDHEKVDVNVHPTKMDVRFSTPIDVHRIISEAVKEALVHREMIPKESLFSENERREEKKALQNERVVAHTPEPFERNRNAQFLLREESVYKANQPQKADFKASPVWSRIKRQEPVKSIDESVVKTQENIVAHATEDEIDIPIETEDFFVEEVVPKAEKDFIIQEKQKEKVYEEVPQQEGQKEIFSKEENNNEDNQKESILKEEVPQDVILIKETPNKEKEIITNEMPVKGTQMNLFDEKILTASNKSKFRIIGQVFDTYWMIQYEDELMIVDQHAAHEKVKFERLMKQYHDKTIMTQVLMPPVIVSLSGQEESTYIDFAQEFAELGFEVEHFGGNEYALRAVPTDLYGAGERELFLDVLDELADGVGRRDSRLIRDRIASMSCKAAVKGNNTLSFAEAQSLIDELLTLENPYNCPHGRPTIVTISKYEMEKKFKRIVD